MVVPVGSPLVSRLEDCLMPETAHRRLDLHDHLVRSRSPRGPELQRLLRQHPEWPICTCGWPVDPAGGTSTHPNCTDTN